MLLASPRLGANCCTDALEKSTEMVNDEPAVPALRVRAHLSLKGWLLLDTSRRKTSPLLRRRDLLVNMIHLLPVMSCRDACCRQPAPFISKKRQLCFLYNAFFAGLLKICSPLILEHNANVLDRKTRPKTSLPTARIPVQMSVCQGYGGLEVAHSDETSRDGSSTRGSVTSMRVPCSSLPE